jgi:hypothetical protein
MLIQGRVLIVAGGQSADCPDIEAGERNGASPVANITAAAKA